LSPAFNSERHLVEAAREFSSVPVSPQQNAAEQLINLCWWISKRSTPKCAKNNPPAPLRRSCAKDALDLLAH
jgi:hypothetical protein